MSYINLIYPHWNQGGSYSRYQMNRAVIAQRWDIFHSILDFSVQEENDSREIRTYALLLCRLNQREDVMRQISDIHGIADLDQSIICIYAMSLLGMPISIDQLWYVIDRTSAENLCGFITSRMRLMLQGSLRWYSLELDRPIVAQVISGDITQLRYVSEMIESPTSPLDMIYPLLMSYVVPKRSIDASQILDIISRSNVVSVSMIQSVTFLAHTYELTLPSDAHPVMIEYLSGYVNIIDTDPARELAVELSRARIDTDDTEGEYVLI